MTVAQLALPISAHRQTIRKVLIALAVCAALWAILQSLRQPAVLVYFTGLPALVLLLIAIALSVTLVCAGQTYVHRRFSDRDFVQHNEVGGFIVAIAGSLYAVVLGFLTLVAWQHYSDARQLVASEAAATTDAWHVAVDLPTVKRTRVRRDILQYAQLMVNNEWPQMKNSGEDLRSGLVIMDAIDATEGFKPTDFGQANAQSATLQQLGLIHDYRQRRLADNSSAVSWFEWLVLVIGAACVVCFCWLFGLANSQVHLLMTSAVTIIITCTLVLLFELQNPFRSGLGISPSDWNAVIDHIHWMQTAGQMDMRM